MEGLDVEELIDLDLDQGPHRKVMNDDYNDIWLVYAWDMFSTIGGIARDCIK